MSANWDIILNIILICLLGIVWCFVFFSERSRKIQRLEGQLAERAAEIGALRQRLEGELEKRRLLERGIREGAEEADRLQERIRQLEVELKEAQTPSPPQQPPPPPPPPPEAEPSGRVGRFLRLLRRGVSGLKQ